MSKRKCPTRSLSTKTMAASQNGIVSARKLPDGAKVVPPHPDPARSVIPQQGIPLLSRGRDQNWTNLQDNDTMGEGSAYNTDRISLIKPTAALSPLQHIVWKANQQQQNEPAPARSSHTTICLECSISTVAWARAIVVYSHNACSQVFVLEIARSQ